MIVIQARRDVASAGPLSSFSSLSFFLSLFHLYFDFQSFFLDKFLCLSSFKNIINFNPSVSFILWNHIDILDVLFCYYFAVIGLYIP